MHHLQRQEVYILKLRIFRHKHVRRDRMKKSCITIIFTILASMLFSVSYSKASDPLWDLLNNQYDAVILGTVETIADTEITVRETTVVYQNAETTKEFDLKGTQTFQFKAYEDRPQIQEGENILLPLVKREDGKLRGGEYAHTVTSLDKDTLEVNKSAIFEEEKDVALINYYVHSGGEPVDFYEQDGKVYNKKNNELIYNAQAKSDKQSITDSAELTDSAKENKTSDTKGENKNILVYTVLAVGVVILVIGSVSMLKKMRSKNR